jgi:hypothetical protein
MPRKDLGCVQSVPLLLEEGDRVNAELQRAPAINEMHQVGVPALDTAKPQGEDGLAGLSANLKSRPRK